MDKATWSYRKEHGLCQYCGKPLDISGSYCSKCKLKMQNYKYDFVVKSLLNDICPSCGQPMDRDGWCCTKCNKKQTAYVYKQSHARRAMGLCVQCGTPVEDGKHIYCQKCRQYRSDRYYKAKEEKQKQG